MRARLVCGVLIALTAAGGLAFRAPRLAARPMHCDEANQAHKTGLLLETGTYEYDPRQHHGPTLYYLTFPTLWISGAATFAESDEWAYRVVPVVFGTGLILLLWFVSDGLGRAEAVGAGLLTAVSPAMVYYSRYYIQETLLVFFSMAVIAAGWRYARSGRLGWAVAAGMAAGLMHATKETCVLSFAAMGAALAPFLVRDVLRRLRGDEPPSETGESKGPGPAVKGWHIAAAIAAAAMVSMVLFSSFFSHAEGPLDSVLAYKHYLVRAHASTQSGAADAAGLHVHPWHYYLSLLAYTKRAPGPWWSEALILGLALVGFAAAFFGKDRATPAQRLLRFLAVYTMVLVALYSLLPYKTPWSMLGFLHGMCLLAGVGAVALVKAARHRVAQAAVCVVLAALLCQLGLQSYRANYVYAADRRNPYVYAHTSTSLQKLAQRVEDVAQVSPQGRNMLVHVVEPRGDYWPLPWYLRKFPRVGYWTSPPESADAAVLVVSPHVSGTLEGRLNDTYHVEHYGLRPGVLLQVYIRADLWDAFMKTRTAPDASPSQGL